MGASRRRTRKIKFSKILVVVCLTVLIWVWADVTQDETSPSRAAFMVVDESTDEKLWVSFSRKPRVQIEVILSGPHSAFVALDRKLDGASLEFAFDAEYENITGPPGRSIQVLDFLQKDKQLKELGLKVRSCEPEIIDVNVVGLVKKTLPVECFDEDGVSQKAENSPSVEMFAPESMRTAQVRLSRSEIEQARSTPIEKTPYIVLAEGLIRNAATPVQIKMPPPTDPLSEVTIEAVKLGIAMSVNLLNKYNVEIINLSEVIGPIKIRATAAASQAYQSMRYQVILEIDDDDVKLKDPRREVIYNFPKESVRKDEIAINQPPAKARFKLEPISPLPDTP